MPTGFQRAPFFEIQTDDFALICVDTGVVKRVDAEQWSWLQSALERARGKLVMAVLGHPFFAGGSLQTDGYEEFAELRRLLREHDVAIIMAGDTHDLEYYVEPQPTGAGGPSLRQRWRRRVSELRDVARVAALDRRRPTGRSIPDTKAVMAKIEADTPWWKRPAWWWTRQLGAWPFSAEWLSAVFDYNVAPFFQSFVEVRVERSTRHIRLRPYGIHGRLTWGDLASSESIRPPGATRATAVEWSVPMAR